MASMGGRFNPRSGFDRFRNAAQQSGPSAADVANARARGESVERPVRIRGQRQRRDRRFAQIGLAARLTAPLAGYSRRDSLRAVRRQNRPPGAAARQPRLSAFIRERHSMTSRDIFVVGTARTAIGTFGGSLKDVPNTQLATTAVKAAIERSGVAAVRSATWSWAT
ncbi:acetyl-CoA acetyltransferase [Ditylenchus destructor]|uniref:Acetyl-CoA acetyltransferase n=1 Tax=Ditylenchus destructor TaxID=166010 RepID=A0AAD4MEE9_9BILA|nr:acetyl-CoA acetyltransferase [Ditylenchus destructor]